ncbi:MAG: HlyD family efflux transporter periplasmic adaptor subunit [Brevundimonas sp.]
MLSEEAVVAGRVLAERQLMAAAQLRPREEQLLANRQQLNALNRQLEDNRYQQEQLAAQLSQLESERAEALAAIDVQSAQFAQSRVSSHASSSQNIVAPLSGRMLSVNVQPGMPVEPGRTIATILPEGATIEAELWLPSRAIGFVRVGDDVAIKYDAFPYQKFGTSRGVVRAISRSPTLPNELPIPLDVKEPLYRVSVTVPVETIIAYGQHWDLAPGMRLSADVTLDRRSLAEWLLEPVMALRGRDGAFRTAR